MNFTLTKWFPGVSWTTYHCISKFVSLTIDSQQSEEFSLTHWEKSWLWCWDTILCKLFSSWVRLSNSDKSSYWQSDFISSFQLSIPNNFRIWLKSLRRFAFQNVTRWLDQIQFSEKIGFGTTKIGLWKWYAKSAVIKLHDHSRASGKKTTSDSHAMSLFLCGKLHAVGLKSN